MNRIELTDVAQNLFDPSVVTQGQQHVTPFHKYVALRLALEGGFRPENITPSTKLISKQETNQRARLGSTDEQDQITEATVLGKYRTKAIDVVVTDTEAGPVLGVSVKTTGKAFRNLTNRVEELVGDAANVHGWYPGFVYGFLHIIKKIRRSDVESDNDASFSDDGTPLDSIWRLHDVLASLNGRDDVAGPADIYESTCLLVLEETESGIVIDSDFPPRGSPIRFETFFEQMYEVYDHRYCYLPARTHHCRNFWKPYVQAPKAIEEIDLNGELDQSGHPYTARLAE